MTTPEPTAVGGVHLEMVLVFSLASPEGGEGRGEETDGFTGSNPLTPTLSPLGRGEGARTGARCAPVGAGRSAIAVHVASRRWLSFFRWADSPMLHAV